MAWECFLRTARASFPHIPPNHEVLILAASAGGWLADFRFIRDGESVATLMDLGKQLLGRRQAAGCQRSGQILESDALGE